MTPLHRPVLITGASGQLGDALAGLAARHAVNFFAVRRPEFDFDRPPSLDSCLAAVKPWLVINTAAFTAVDAAEANQPQADQANHRGPARLAALCADSGILLIHISTDYVFDGSKGAPYVEQDATNPASVYGATKRAGEIAVLASGADAIVLRTAWLYAAHGRNFVRTILNAARRTDRLRVVGDQLGTPTAAPDLARIILRIAAILQDGWRPEYRGITHATSAGETSWHGFACAILAAAAARGLHAPGVDAIATSEWPTPAKRPADSRLDCTRLAEIFGCRIPHWRETLPSVVAQMIPVTSRTSA